MKFASTSIFGIKYMQAAARTITPASIAVFLSMVNCAIDCNILSVFVPWFLSISICGMLRRERMDGVRMIVRIKETMIPKAQKNPSSRKPPDGMGDHRYETDH